MKDIKIITILALAIIIGSLAFTIWNEKNDDDQIENKVIHHEDANDEDELVVEESQVEQQIKDMTIDEKIGQLIISSVSSTSLTTDMRKLFDTYKVGGFIFFSHNFESEKQALSLINDLKSANEHNDIPLFLSVDQEGGRVTRLPGLLPLPSNLQLSEQENEALVYDYGEMLSQQLLQYGLNMNYAPVLDVLMQDENDAIGDRSFGDDVDIVSSYGIQLMHGLQDNRIIPVVKHFPGQGDVSEDSHEELPVNDKELDEVIEEEITPFQRAINQGAEVVMVGHLLFTNIDDQYPSSLSSIIISDLLRDGLAFDGVVITDDLMMKAITDEYSVAEAVELFIHAGGDIALVTSGVDSVGDVFYAIKEAVEKGDISEERIDESVRRILLLKEKYELQDQMVDQIDIEKLNDEIKQLNKKMETPEQ